MTDERLTSWMNVPNTTRDMRFITSYHEHCNKIPSGFKACSTYLKQKFGRKHDWYYRGCEINYGWTDPVNGDWRIIVSTRGKSFEVNKNFTSDQVIAAFEEYRNLVE